MRKHFCPATALVAVILIWLGYATSAHSISLWVARKCGPTLVRIGDGKFSDPALFLQHRLYEAAWLITAVVVLGGLAIYLGGLVARRLPCLWKWVPYSVTGFVALNLCIKVASGTCLFWCLFWNGKGTTDNLTQFHIKLQLMDENRAETKVVLAGSSQVHAEIDPGLLNREFGSNMFTTELHFPGNHTFDLLFLERKLAGHRADVVITYVSEGNFYLGGLSDGASLFFSFGDLPEFVELGGRLGWSPKTMWYSFLANVAPVFWIRDPITERVLGGKLAHLQQNERDAALPPDLLLRARVAAPLYRADAQSQFCYRAFDAFIEQCRARQQTVVICCGQANPILGRELNPALRAEMVRHLQNLSKTYANVLLLDQNDLPQQTESDYEDLSHVNAEARARFTRFIGTYLQEAKSSGRLGSANAMVKPEAIAGELATGNL